jgi:hypothetical protein
MSDTLTKTRGGTIAESLAKHGQWVKPAPETPARVPEEAAPQSEASSAGTANGDGKTEIEPVVVGGKRTRRYTGQERISTNTGLSTLYVHDSESGLVYELEYEKLGPKLWTPKQDVMVLEFKERHVGLEGERLAAMLDEIAARRLGELSAAARPEMDPRIEGKAHLRGVIVRLPGYMRIANGKLHVLPEYDEKHETAADAALELVEANA